MKYVIILFTGLTLISCNDFFQQNNFKEKLSDENYLIRELDSFENQDPWGAGNYGTMYDSEKVPGSLEEVKEMLSYFRTNGLRLYVAWFSKGESSCGMLQAVVPDEVVLKIEPSSIVMLNPNQRQEFSAIFKPINTNTAIWCPLKVYEITPR